MPWRLTLTRCAERDLATLSRSQCQAVIETLERAATDPGSVDLAKLRGRPDEWRIRSGGYRAIVQLDNQAGLMIVIRVLQGKDAYRD